jgi:phage head maturation protease
MVRHERGRDTYALLKMTPRPALDGLSIGFRARDFELHKSGPVKRTLKAIELVEVSLVTFPANRLATVTNVKSEVEAAPEMTMKELARADFEFLRSEMTKGESKLAITDGIPNGASVVKLNLAS